MVIFAFLGIHDVVNCKRVCRYWNHVLPEVASNFAVRSARQLRELPRFAHTIRLDLKHLTHSNQHALYGKGPKVLQVTGYPGKRPQGAPIFNPEDDRALSPLDLHLLQGKNQKKFILPYLTTKEGCYFHSVAMRVDDYSAFGACFRGRPLRPLTPIANIARVTLTFSRRGITWYMQYRVLPNLLVYLSKYAMVMIQLDVIRYEDDPRAGSVPPERELLAHAKQLFIPRGGRPRPKVTRVSQGHGWGFQDQELPSTSFPTCDPLPLERKLPALYRAPVPSNFPILQKFLKAFENLHISQTVLKPVENGLFEVDLKRITLPDINKGSPITPQYVSKERISSVLLDLSPRHEAKILHFGVLLLLPGVSKITIKCTSDKNWSLVLDLLLYLLRKRRTLDVLILYFENCDTLKEIVSLLLLHNLGVSGRFFKNLELYVTHRWRRERQFLPEAVQASMQNKLHLLSGKGQEESPLTLSSPVRSARPADPLQATAGPLGDQKEQPSPGLKRPKAQAPTVARKKQRVGSLPPEVGEVQDEEVEFDHLFPPGLCTEQKLIDCVGTHNMPLDLIDKVFRPPVCNIGILEVYTSEQFLSQSTVEELFQNKPNVSKVVLKHTM